MVLVRDGKDPSGPTPEAWRPLVAHLRRAKLD